MMYLKDLRERIINTINSSSLDVDMVYFVMKDIMSEVSSAYHQEIMKENAKQQEEELKPLEEGKNIEEEEK